jgi:endonuclease YncB( thermonuclease family)
MAWRRRRRARRTIAGRLLDYVTLVLLVSALLYVAAQLPGLDLAGGARAIDGDSLKVDGVEIRLFGVDAPEALQTCQDGAGAQWSCGRDAARTLRRLIGMGEVACRAHEEDAYGRAVARCQAGDVDLGAEMVRLGMAVVLIEGITQYAPQLAEARAARRGLWQGSFVEPADWRAGQPR